MKNLLLPNRLLACCLIGLSGAVLDFGVCSLPVHLKMPDCQAACAIGRASARFGLVFGLVVAAGATELRRRGE